MARNDTTSAVIDNILRLVVGGTAISSALLLPGLAIALDKPLQAFFNTMDERSRQRELSRILSYMKSRSLISDQYAHGLVITEKGRQRLSEKQFENLQIQGSVKWDGLWRIVFYDIPEKSGQKRRFLSQKLADLGFYQLQRSVWIHTFPCRDILETISDRLETARYTSLIEASYIDNQIKLIEHFQKKYPATHYK